MKKLDWFIDEMIEKAAAFDRIVEACVEDGMEIEALMLIKRAIDVDSGKEILNKSLLLDEILKEALSDGTKPDVTNKGKSDKTVKQVTEPEILAHVPRANPTSGPHGTTSLDVTAWR